MKHKPKQKRLPRDGAGSFQLPADAGPTTFMCPNELAHELEIYSATKTYYLQTPDSLDPERTNPNMRFAIAKRDDLGSAEPAIARTFIMVSEMLRQGAVLDPTVSKDAVINQVHRLKTSLVQCLKVSNVYDKDLAAAVAAFEATDDSSLKRSAVEVPVLSNLEERVTTFLITARRAIREVCALLALFVPMEREHSNLDYALKELEQKVPSDKPLLSVVRGHADGVRTLCELRDFQEHPKPGKSLHIENFRLMPTHQIRRPVWYVDGETPKDIPSQMKGIIEFLIGLVEECTVTGIDLRLRNDFPYIIVQHESPPAECPIRFQLTLDVSRLNFPKPRPPDDPNSAG